MRFTKVTLCPLTENDREAFVLGNQEAFRYGALEEFGLRDNHLDRDGEIISRETIECCLNDPCCEAYRIVCDGKTVGGVVLRIDTLTLGRLWRHFIRKPACGKPVRRISISEICIFISINAAFMR